MRISTLVVCAFAAIPTVCASAQVVSAQFFGAKFDLTARSTGDATGNLPWGPTGSVVTVNNSSSAQSVRFEFRYQVSDSRPTDRNVIIGYGGGEFVIRSNVIAASGASLSFGRLLATDNGDPVPARDGVVPAGLAFAPLPALALANPFRPDPGNRGRLGTRPDGTLGTLDGTLDGFPIVPLQLSPPPTIPDLDTSYFLYTFNLNIPQTVQPGAYTVSLVPTFDLQFVYAINTLSPNNTEFLQVPTANVSLGVGQVTVNVIPAPSSILLLAGPAVWVTRRRR